MNDIVKGRLCIFEHMIESVFRSNIRHRDERNFALPVRMEVEYFLSFGFGSDARYNGKSLLLVSQRAGSFKALVHVASA